MRVLKRGNRGYENVKLDKITQRVATLCNGLDSSIDPTRVAILTAQNIYDGILTEDLDVISARIAESLKTVHPDYGTLAGRICISNLHKSTNSRFSECMQIVNERVGCIAPHYMEFIRANAEKLNGMIIHENDYLIDYMGFDVLKRGYLIRHMREVTVNGVSTWAEDIIDRPQYVWMRVAIAIYAYADGDLENRFENIKQCYKALSQLLIVHATPTLFNSCTKNQQLGSCFLAGTADSIEEIHRTLGNVGVISKRAGGVSIWMHNIRARNSHIGGTNGKSSGLLSQIKIYNEVARCWDQGGKRLGAFAVYLEPWHADIFTFLQMKLNTGAETERARDLFYALWMPNLFYERVLTDADWSLFSEDTAPGLSDVYDGMQVCGKCGFCENRNYMRVFYRDRYPDLLPSERELSDLAAQNAERNGYSMRPVNTGTTDEDFYRRVRQDAAACQHEYAPRSVFTELYERYEREGRARRKVKARDVVDAIIKMQRESGTPYMLNKDHVNRKSNQSAIGTIKSSNLCCEIVEWSSEYSYATCTLASVNLRGFLTHDGRNADGSIRYRINHEQLHEAARMAVRNLDRVIDINIYPVSECVENSRGYRPIAVGIQGLANVFCAMRIPFLSTEAARVDLEICETISHAAYTESMNLAKTHGPHREFAASPAANGRLSFDLWQEDIDARGVDIWVTTGLRSLFSGRYDWDALKRDIREHGLRNSLLIAHMPTVSTSQITGNAESFEPFSSNIYMKTTLSGKCTVTNAAMIRHLIELGLWNDTVKNQIIQDGGSLRNVKSIPPEVARIYETVWELSQREIMRRAAIRGAFVDQSQSVNLHFENPSNAALRSAMINGNKFGMKTGSYYIRTKPATEVLRNNISEVANLKVTTESVNNDETPACRRDNPDCVSCAL